MCYDNDCIAVVLPSFLVILQYNTGLYLSLSNISVTLKVAKFQKVFSIFTKWEKLMNSDLVDLFEHGIKRKYLLRFSHLYYMATVC